MFTAAVVGGLGSLFGGVLGAVFLRGSEWFITAPEWRLLSSAVIGVLIVLLILPGGLASLVIKVRDRLVTIIVGRTRPPSVAPDTATRDTTGHRDEGAGDTGPTGSPIEPLAVSSNGADANSDESQDDLDDRTTV